MYFANFLPRRSEDGSDYAGWTCKNENNSEGVEGEEGERGPDGAGELGAWTELETLLILDSTNTPRLTALGKLRPTVAIGARLE